MIMRLFYSPLLSEFLKSKTFWDPDFLRQRCPTFCNEFETTLMNAFIAGCTFCTFEPSFCTYHMHFISKVGPIIPIFLKIVWIKEIGHKMFGLFKNYVRDPRSQDPRSQDPGF